MTTIEMIQAEIGRIPEQRLGELYLLIKHFSETAPRQETSGIMSKLRAIQIEGPVDFSTNSAVTCGGAGVVHDSLG